ncbi:hypothetical protein BANRA_05306 [Klebsiella pneumoniae]|nr:hypothetical protein BANRA_05306 [Klebsiella pneumoniae]
MQTQASTPGKAPNPTAATKMMPMISSGTDRRALSSTRATPNTRGAAPYCALQRRPPPARTPLRWPYRRCSSPRCRSRGESSFDSPKSLAAWPRLPVAMEGSPFSSVVASSSPVPAGQQHHSNTIATCPSWPPTRPKPRRMLALLCRQRLRRNETYRCSHRGEVEAEQRSHFADHIVVGVGDWREGLGKLRSTSGSSIPTHPAPWFSARGSVRAHRPGYWGYSPL